MSILTFTELKANLLAYLINATEIPADKLNELLQDTLDTIEFNIDDFSEFFKGLAETTTDPGTPTSSVMYQAAATGTYTNFDGLVVTKNLAFLVYNGSAWELTETDIDMTGYVKETMDADVDANYKEIINLETDIDESKAAVNVETVGKLGLLLGANIVDNPIFVSDEYVTDSAEDQYRSGEGEIADFETPYGRKALMLERLGVASTISSNLFIKPANYLNHSYPIKQGDSFKGGIWVKAVNYDTGARIGIQIQQGAYTSYSYVTFDGTWQYIESPEYSLTSDSNIIAMILFARDLGTTMATKIYIASCVVANVDFFKTEINNLDWFVDGRTNAIIDPQILSMQESINYVGKNSLDGFDFQEITVGELGDWTNGYGGTGSHAGTAIIVNDYPSPFGTKTMKLGVDYINSSNFADVQLGKVVNIPDYLSPLTTANKWSYAFKFKRDHLGVSIGRAFLSFYSEKDGGGTILSQYQDTGTGYGEISGDGVSDWAIYKFNETQIPANTKSIKISIRINGSSELPDTNFYHLWLGAVAVHFENDTTEFVDLNIYDISKRKAAEAIVDAGVLTQSTLNSKVDDYNYGANIRNFLSKVRSGVIDNKRKEDIVIVFLTDSIGATGSPSYPEQLRTHLKTTFGLADSNFDFQIYGGYDSRDFSKLFEDSAINPNADLVIYSEWSNIKKEMSRTEAIIKQIREKTSADICLGTWSANEDMLTTGISLYEDSMDFIRDLAVKFNCELIDLQYSFFKAIDEDGYSIADLVSTDHTHPTQTGVDILSAEAIKHFKNNKYNELFLNENFEKEYAIEICNPSVFPNMNNDEITLNGTWVFVEMTGSITSDYEKALGLGYLQSIISGNYIEVDFIGVGIELFYVETSAGSNSALLIDSLSPSAIKVNGLPLEYATPFSEKSSTDPYFKWHRFFKVIVDEIMLANGESELEFELEITSVSRDGSDNMIACLYTLRHDDGAGGWTVVGTGKSIFLDEVFTIRTTGQLTIPAEYSLTNNYRDYPPDAKIKTGDKMTFFVRPNWIDALDTTRADTIDEVRSVKVFGLSKGSHTLRLTKSDSGQTRITKFNVIK